MHYRIVALAFGLAALTAACTTASGTPATAPSVPDTVPTTTSPAPIVTTTIAPATTTPATTLPDRLSEIQAIYEDLEHRRVQALWAGNRDAFLSLFIDTPYRDESLRALDLIETGEPPVLTVEIDEIFMDDSECLVFAANIVIDGSEDRPAVHTVTLQPLADGWGYAYVSDDPGGWLCTEPHPLSG